MKVFAATESSASSVSTRTISKNKTRNLVIKKLLLTIPIISSILGLILGCLSLSINNLESYPIPILLSLGLCLLTFFFYHKRINGNLEKKLLILAGLSILSAFILSVLHVYTYGLQINGIIHRSFFSALFLIAFSIPTLCYAIYYFLGASPSSFDSSRYPLIVVPIILILSAYSILIYRIFSAGVSNLGWHMLITPFQSQGWRELVWQNDWPTWMIHTVNQTGIANYILGTLELMVLTVIISLPIGIGVGVYISEYSGGLLSKIIKFSCSSLRSISVFILGLTAVTLVEYTSGTFLSSIFTGFYYDLSGNRYNANGSFITAAIVISLLVIPIIARATEEGIRSTPIEIKEGSLALGTSSLHTLTHVLIPWSLPNIVTGLLLGCAEAGGSLATIMFIAGAGQNGVMPWNGVTSLSYFIYFTRLDIDAGFRKSQGLYQYPAALILLIITIGLSIAVVVLKRKFSKRYRGA